MNEKQVVGRLDRLETKIDKLTEVLATMARVEERLTGIDARLKRHETRLGESEKKTDELTETVTKNAVTAKNAEKLFWSVWAAIVGYIVYLIKG